MKPVIAVLGASGFIGSRIVERLHLEDLAVVRPVVRRAAGLAGASRFALDGRVADGFDRPALRTAFEGCDVVVHAIAGDRATILGTLEPVYMAAQDAGVRRLVYLSTASVHGQAPPPGTDEDSPLSDRQPIPYNNAKVHAEWRLRQLRERGKVELVLLRPGIVFGPRSYWTAGLADELLAGEAYLAGDGTGICNSIYVDNLVHAIYLAATTAGVDGHAFLLGDAERVTWEDLYRPIVAALGLTMEEVPRISFHPPTPTWKDRVERLRASAAVQHALARLPNPVRQGLGAFYAAWYAPPQAGATHAIGASPRPTLEKALLHQCRYKLPFDKATRMLGYHPLVSFDEGCRRSVAWLAFAGYPVTGEGVPPPPPR